MMRSFFKKIDWILVLSVVPLFLGSLATLTSFGADQANFWKQFTWVLVGFGIIFGVARMDVRFLRDSRYISILYITSLFFLTLVLATHSVNGAKSWFNIAGISFQPVDFAKIFVILMLAKYFSRRHVAIKEIKHLYISALYVLVPIFLIMLQPDLGSALIIIGLWIGMALAAGISKKHLLIVFGIGFVTFVAGWFLFFKPYQKERIVNFINPMHDIRKSGYNVYQSTIAVGSGGVLGKGVGYGTQSRLHYLPEYKTDFMFAAFSEEWGLLGDLIILISFGIFFWRIFVHASLGASNFETLFCIGFAIMVFGHMVINIGMNIGLMPVTGIPLPFMSYGGSHLINECLGLGIILSMARFERAIHRDDLNKEFYGYIN